MNAPRAVLLAAIPAAFLAGSVAARVWLVRAPARIATDLAQPLVVVTAWGSAGTLAFAILAATVAVATVALLGALREEAHSPRADDRATPVIVAVAALALAAAGSWPFVFSSDVYAYAAYADLAGRGLDPYVRVPPGAHDAFLDAARWQWSGTFPPDVYGPGMLAGADLVLRFTGSHGVAVTLGALRLLAALAFLGSIALLGRLLDSWAPHRRFIALGAYGLNPAILWSVAEGHNDAFLLFWVSAAAVAARYGRPLTGSFALGLSPLFKAPGALLAVGFALDDLVRRRAGWRAATAAAAGIAVAIAVALPPLLPQLRTLEHHGRYAPAISPQGLIGPAPALALVTAACAAGVWRLWAGHRDGHAWLGLALALALPNLYPWYALWLVPWAIAAGGGCAARALWTVTIFAPLRYLPDAVGTMSEGAAHLAAAIATLPFLLAVLGLGQVPRPKKVTATT